MEIQLQAAELSFKMIGLPKTASILTRARIQFSLDSPVSLGRVVTDMENALLAVEEPVDEIIELFAKRELAPR